MVLLEEEDAPIEVAGYFKSVKHFVDFPPPVVFDGSDRGLSVVAVLIGVGRISTTCVRGPLGDDGRARGGSGRGRGEEGRGGR